MTRRINRFDNFHHFDEEWMVMHQANCQKDIEAILDELKTVVQDSRLPQARRDWLAHGLVHIRWHIRAEIKELLWLKKWRVN